MIEGFFGKRIVERRIHSQNGEGFEKGSNQRGNAGNRLEQRATRKDQGQDVFEPLA